MYGNCFRSNIPPPTKNNKQLTFNRLFLSLRRLRQYSLYSDSNTPTGKLNACSACNSGINIIEAEPTMKKITNLHLGKKRELNQ